MSLDERRAALIDATLPLLQEHGKAVPTRLIAEAAGVAEGTIFRAFASKDELIAAVVDKVFEPDRLAEEIAALADVEPLRDRALALVRLMQKRMSGGFLLLQKLGLQRPPAIPSDPDRARAMRQTTKAAEELFAPYQDQLQIPAADVVRTLRLLTFSGTHPKFTGGADVLTPEQIVDTVLYGAVVRAQEGDMS